jgi:hypothetical protein
LGIQDERIHNSHDFYFMWNHGDAFDHAFGQGLWPMIEGILIGFVVLLWVLPCLAEWIINKELSDD